jgi:hypothetical protein
MFLIPHRHTVIHSPHPPGSIADHLRRITAPRQPWLKSLYGKFDFIGSVSPTQFRITPVGRGRNSYLPVLRGRMRPAGEGAEIEIVETLPPAIIAVLLGTFVLLPLVLAGFRRDFFIWLAALFLFHCGMYFIGFLPAARGAEDRIRQIAG